MTSITPPPCPDCSTVTERIGVEGEEVWRCTAPGCGGRTYGTGDQEDDQDLPPYTETDKTGAVICYHGDGEVDVEATAELAAQDEPGDPEPGHPNLGDSPTWPAEPEVRDVRVKDLAHALAGGWAWIYGDPEGWRFFTRTSRTTPTTTPPSRLRTAMGKRSARSRGPRPVSCTPGPTASPPRAAPARPGG
ncbi:hypothetical protein ACIOUE_35815 [Streptomyces xanthochromogenes]|uniref:hypothetical protein n=1 Tax=Streptomyces xanthochromogenes TaxID=67384 RepID=UPI0038013FB4